MKTMEERKQLWSAFANGGLPQFAEKVAYGESEVFNFSKNEMKEIKKQIIDFDNYFISGWKESETRQTLVNFIEEYVDIFRSYSLLVK